MNHLEELAMNFPRSNTRPANRRRRSCRPNLEEVEGRLLLSNAPLYVLGDNGNLWLESPGWQTTGRTFVDWSVKAYAPAAAGDLYVLGDNGNLWLESPYWQTTGRTFIDSNVESFAEITVGSSFATAGAGDLYVEGTNGALWMEGPGWQSGGRTLIDTSVKAYAADPFGSGCIYVLGDNGNLWLEYPGWQSFARSEIDSNVGSFAPDPYLDDYLYVDGTNGNLWLESTNWQSTGGRTFIDSTVASFVPDAYNGYLYVEGTNGNLWWEYPGWQTYGRYFIDSGVGSFAPDPSAFGYAYVDETNGELWLESSGWQTNGRTFVDSSVLAFAVSGPLDPAAATGYSPAPAGAGLFNNNEPSYLDVEQGGVGDCWLLASLAEVADRDPQFITNMFHYDGTTVDNGATVGLYTVRFFNANGSAIYVQVDTDFPTNSYGEYYDNVDNARGTQALWVALAEKAYAEANALGLVTTGKEYQDSYAALGSGYPSWALQAITGEPAGDFTFLFASLSPALIANAWNAGAFVVLSTNSPSSSLLVSDHAYALVGYNPSSSLPFQVFNPWGANSSGLVLDNNTGQWVYGLFNANASYISNNFNGDSIATSAINVVNPSDPVNDLNGPATRGDGDAGSGTAALGRSSPRGGVESTETADLLGNGSDNTAAGYARPAQGMSTGTDPWDPASPATVTTQPLAISRSRRNGWW
jgi:hypothetical protein